MRYLQRADTALLTLLQHHSIRALRVALGLIFLTFGLLKIAPDVSPAETLSVKTMSDLTLGTITGSTARLTVATLEVTIGLLLVTHRWMRVAVYLLAGQLVGILAPLALYPARLFAGPHHAPTLEGQYVLKDIILVAAGLVVASTLPTLTPGSELPGQPTPDDPRR